MPTVFWEHLTLFSNRLLLSAPRLPNQQIIVYLELMNKTFSISFMIGLFAHEIIQCHFVVQSDAQVPVMAHYLGVAVDSMKVGAETERFQTKLLFCFWVSICHRTNWQNYLKLDHGSLHGLKEADNHQRYQRWCCCWIDTRTIGPIMCLCCTALQRTSVQTSIVIAKITKWIKHTHVVILLNCRHDKRWMSVPWLHQASRLALLASWCFQTGCAHWLIALTTKLYAYKPLANTS